MNQEMKNQICDKNVINQIKLITTTYLSVYSHQSPIASSRALHCMVFKIVFLPEVNASKPHNSMYYGLSTPGNPQGQRKIKRKIIYVLTNLRHNSISIELSLSLCELESVHSRLSRPSRRSSIPSDTTFKNKKMYLYLKCTYETISVCL